MRPLIGILLACAWSSAARADDACTSFVAKTGGERLDLAPPKGFVDVCSQSAALCTALTQGYPASVQTVGYFATIDEWARAKKGELPGFTNYLIAQISLDRTPADLPGLKAFVHSKQGDVPDHTTAPDFLKVHGEVNLGIVAETDDSIVFGHLARLRTPASSDKDVVVVGLNAGVVVGPRLLSLYTFRDYKSAKDLDAAKALTNTWLRCLRTANAQGRGKVAR